jgi:DNA-binding XRE family transcriptional regulator
MVRRLRRGVQLAKPFAENRLADFRIAKNMTQKEIAERVRIPRGTYAHLEIGTYLPTRQILASICDVLGCSSEDIYSQEVISQLG